MRGNLARAVSMATRATWTFDEASNGEEAIAMARKVKYDVIFIDFYMRQSGGKLTGAEAAMELQNLGSGNFIGKGSSHVVMIGVTGGGSANEHEAAELRAAGCIDVWR